MSQQKAISPIIAIIIILLITIAIAGAGYSYISAYWTSLVGKQIQVVSSFCTGGTQGKVMVKNIGTNPLETGDITIINPLTGEDITQDITWASQVSDPSLVLELKFEEGSGTTAGDTSGQGNDGTLVGNPQWVEGRMGGALSFDEVGDNIQISRPLGLAGNPFTFSHWIKTTIAAGQVYIIGNAGGGNGYRFGMGGGRIQFLIGNSLGHTEKVCGATAVNDEKWHL